MGTDEQTKARKESNIFEQAAAKGMENRKNASKTARRTKLGQLLSLASSSSRKPKTTCSLNNVCGTEDDTKNATGTAWKRDI